MPAFYPLFSLELLFSWFTDRASRVWYTTEILQGEPRLAYRWMRGSGKHRSQNTKGQGRYDARRKGRTEIEIPIGAYPHQRANECLHLHYVYKGDDR